MLAVLRLRCKNDLKVQKLINLVFENNFVSVSTVKYKWYNTRKALQLKLVLENALEASSALQFQRSSSHHSVNFAHNHFKQRSLPDFNEGSYGSRLHPPSAVEQAEEKIRDCLSEKSLYTVEDWNEIKSKLMIDIEILSDVNFSSVMMNSLLILNKVDEATSFMRYMEEVNMEVNSLTYLIYMTLCGKNVEKCGQEVILQTFNKVKAIIDAAPILDFKRTEYVIQGLCSTDQWKLSLEYLKKFPNKPNMVIKNSLASAAIKNGDEALAWDILTKWLKAEDKPNNQVFKEFLLYALRLYVENPRRSEMLVAKLFQYIQDKYCIVNEDVVKCIEEYFRCHSSKWHVAYSKVNRSGECDSCKKSLKIVDLSEDDFRYLRDSFLERSLKKTDLFINTTQREFDQYLRFIHSRKPFDIILDGLNTAYTVQNIKSVKNLANQLLKVVENLSGRSQKLLVLGKHHMSKWPNSIMTKISQRATLFLTSNISQDDPFMVYAALASGSHSCILSMDLMRDHVSRLNDPKLIGLFKRWQQTHQIYLTVDGNNEIKFIEPLRHSINIQGSMKEGWHIPYDNKFILDPYEEMNNWLCIQKIK